MGNKVNGKRILITGGTGSLGTALVERLLSGENGIPEKVAVFSRDEDKQHEMRMAHQDKKLHFVIGDVRDEKSVRAALKNIDIVFHAAALKHVPTCQNYPIEAIKTNELGTIHIVEAIRDFNLPVGTVVGVSSDKGCHPVNVYGATKFNQEQILLQANTVCPDTRFIAVCYGNVLASRGSVIPVFKKQIESGGPVTITDPNMTRFLISLSQAVDTLLTALEYAQRGEVYVPIIPSAYIGDIAKVLIGDRKMNIKYVGKRPGEKVHEVLITGEEAERVVRRGDYYVVTQHIQERPLIRKEYISCDYLIGEDELLSLFEKEGLLDRVKQFIGEAAI